MTGLREAVWPHTARQRRPAPTRAGNPNACESDEECGAGERCRRMKCKKCIEREFECESDQDCCFGLSCQNGGWFQLDKKTCERTAVLVSSNIDSWDFTGVHAGSGSAAFGWITSTDDGEPCTECVEIDAVSVFSWTAVYDDLVFKIPAGYSEVAIEVEDVCPNARIGSFIPVLVAKMWPIPEARSGRLEAVVWLWAHSSRRVSFLLVAEMPCTFQRMRFAGLQRARVYVSVPGAGGRAEVRCWNNPG